MGVGILLLLAELGVDVGPNLFYGFLGGVLAAGSASFILGVALLFLVHASANWVSSSPSRSDATGLGLTSADHHAGILASALGFVYTLVAAVAFSFPFQASVSLSDFAFDYFLLDFWLLASLTLLAMSVTGGRFLREYLPIAGLHREPFAHMFEFAGLTVISVIALIGSLSIISGGLLFTVATIPFAVSPAVGFLAFGRLFQLGTSISLTRRTN